MNATEREHSYLLTRDYEAISNAYRVNNSGVGPGVNVLDADAIIKDLASGDLALDKTLPPGQRLMIALGQMLDGMDKDNKHRNIRTSEGGSFKFHEENVNGGTIFVRYQMPQLIPGQSHSPHYALSDLMDADSAARVQAAIFAQVNGLDVNAAVGVVSQEQKAMSFQDKLQARREAQSGWIVSDGIKPRTHSM